MRVKRKKPKSLLRALFPRTAARFLALWLLAMLLLTVRELDAQRERLESARAPREEPMKRYPHPIPCPADCPAWTGAEALDRVLEELACQNQLLLELLSAVNGLTAAVLSIQGRL